MCKGFSDITVQCPHEHPCVAVLFSFTFCGCALADSKFCFQFYQFNTTENEVGIKAFCLARFYQRFSRRLALGPHAISDLFTCAKLSKHT